MPTELDTVHALRARLQKRKTELEAHVSQFQNEIEEINEVIDSLSKAPKILELVGSLINETPIVNPSVRKRVVHKDLPAIIQNLLRSLTDKLEGDKIAPGNILERLQNLKIDIKSHTVYMALRREADKKDGLLIFNKGEGFILAREPRKS